MAPRFQKQKVLSVKQMRMIRGRLEQLHPELRPPPPDAMDRYWSFASEPTVDDICKGMAVGGGGAAAVEEAKEAAAAEEAKEEQPSAAKEEQPKKAKKEKPKKAEEQKPSRAAKAAAKAAAKLKAEEEEAAAQAAQAAREAAAAAKKRRAQELDATKHRNAYQRANAALGPVDSLGRGPDYWVRRAAAVKKADQRDAKRRKAAAQGAELRAVLAQLG